MNDRVSDNAWYDYLDTIDFDIREIAERWWKAMDQYVPGKEVADDLINQFTLVSLDDAIELREWFNL